MWSSADTLGDAARGPAIQPFVYPPAFGELAGNSQQNSGFMEEPTEVSEPDRQAKHAPPPVQATKLSEEEVRVKEDHARASGMREGEARSRAKYETEFVALRESIAKALQDFAQEREGYFCRVEAEVVKLAVGIARKILHREVQVDPLLLAGVVRVALEKMAAGTNTRLRVHPDHVYAWHEFFANQGDHRPVPELLGDATLGTGHCVLETALGTTELTLEAQLAEIERGFFDLLAQRPVKS